MTKKLSYQAPESFSVTILIEDVVCNPSTGEHFNDPFNFEGWDEEE